MECTESELSTGLADRPGSDHTHSLAFLDEAVVGKVAAIALGADTLLRLTGEHGADLDTLDVGGIDAVGGVVGDLLTGSHDHFVGLGIDDVVDAHTAYDTFAERGHHFVVGLDLAAYEAAESAAVFLVDDHVVGHVDRTAGEITGVGGLQSGISQTFSGTVGGDEVLKHGEALLKVGKNRVFDDLATFGTGFLGLGHKTTHAGELTDLVF